MRRRPSLTTPAEPARAALALQAAAAEVLADNPCWPRFRVGLKTGPAIVGNVGSEDLRNFSAIGDTTNVAALLEGAALAGGVLIGARGPTSSSGPMRAGGGAAVAALDLNGKTEPVRAYVLDAVG